MFAPTFEKQPCRNVSKINSSSEAAIKIHFSISLFCTLVKFSEKYLWWSAIFSEFACNALQLLTTAVEKPYFITTLINVEQQLLQNTSRKLLLCLEAKIKLSRNFKNAYLSNLQNRSQRQAQISKEFCVQL